MQKDCDKLNFLFGAASRLELLIFQISINQPISDYLADYEDNSYKGKDTSNGSDQTRSHSVALIRGPCPPCPRRRGHQGPRSATGLFSSSISDRILLLSLPRG